MAIKSLREYKAFLPNTLFVASESEDEDSPSSDTKSSAGTHHRSRVSAGTLAVNKVVNTGVLTHKGTIVRLQLDSLFYTNFPQNFDTLVEAINEAGQATRGVVHGFSVADPLCFTVTWNIAQKCADSVARALSFATWVVGNSKVKDITLPTVAVATGSVLAGSLGSATSKGFGISGETMTQVAGISEVATMMLEHCRHPVILAAPMVAEVAAGKYEFHALTLLQLRNAKGPLLLRQVVSAIEVKQEEWMYQLEEAQTMSVDRLLEALLALQKDPRAGQRVEVERDFTSLQLRAAENINEGRAMMTYGAAWDSGSRSDPMTF